MFWIVLVMSQLQSPPVETRSVDDVHSQSVELRNKFEYVQCPCDIQIRGGRHDVCQGCQQMKGPLIPCTWHESRILQERSVPNRLMSWYAAMQEEVRMLKQRLSVLSATAPSRAGSFAL